MKRRDLLVQLEKRGCRFFREGGNHTIYLNPATRLTSSVPRHREIHEFLARKIFHDLGLK